MLFDEIMATGAKTLGVSVPSLFFGAYLLGMILLFGGIVAVGQVLFRSWWTTALLAGLLTLRHRITQTGANTLEGYFQPRMIVFALGVWAVAACLRGRAGLALALLGPGITLHPTTALWFGTWIVRALAVSERRLLSPLVAVTATWAAAGACMVAFGPLRGHLGRIDPPGPPVLAGKDYLSVRLGSGILARELRIPRGRARDLPHAAAAGRRAAARARNRGRLRLCWWACF